MRRVRALRAVERGLFAVGGLCLAVYAGACAHSTLAQARDQQAFESALAEVLHSERYDQSDWDATRIAKHERSLDAPTAPLARLEIPDADLSVMVLEGTDDWTLNRGVGHIEGTARLDEPGNVGIAGHRDSFFRGLRHLALGDPMSLSTRQGVRHYEVVDLRIVRPEDVEVLEPTEERALTLVTCHPFYYVGDAPERFIVRAREVGFEPWNGVPGGAGGLRVSDR
jgi:sortase A